MKKIPVILILASICVMPRMHTGQEVIEEIAAIVNDDIITVNECREQYNIIIDQLRAQQLSQEEFDAERKNIRDNLLDIMIREMLLLQEARAMNLNISEELRASIEAIKKENNLATDADLRKALEQQGVSYEVWIKQYEETLLRQAVMYSEVDRLIVMDDSEIVQYYRLHPDEFTVPTEYTLLGIYLAQGTASTDEIAARRSEISAKIQTADFSEVAAEHSDPPLNETKGDMGGSFKAGELDRTLEEAIENLNVGEVSAWTEARNGWYLLKLEDKTESHLQAFEDIRDDVEQRLYMEKREEKLEEYIVDLRDRSYVRILRPNPFDYF